MPRVKSKKAGQTKSTTILDLGSGKVPMWLASIARRHPLRRFEAVDPKMTKSAKGFAENLHRITNDAFKRLKKSPSKSVAVITMNFSECDIFYERALSGMKGVKKATAILEKGSKAPDDLLEIFAKTMEGFNVFPPEFLKEVKRVLKPNGAFVVVTSNLLAEAHMPHLSKHFDVKTIKLPKEKVMRSGTKAMKRLVGKGLSLVKIVCKV